MQGKAYVPWYKASKNTFVSQVDMFDGVKDHGYIITVYTSLNKKGETVEDIIRVKHLGKIDVAMINEYLKEKQMPIYYREPTPENVNQESVNTIIEFLKGYL
jgi:hypothetical protein